MINCWPNKMSQATCYVIDELFTQKTVSDSSFI